MGLVNGYIKNTEGGAVPFASVAVFDGNFEATGEGTAAGYNGAFAFTVDPYNEPYALEVTSIGYKPARVLLSSWRNGATIALQSAAVTNQNVTVTSAPRPPAPTSKPFPYWLFAVPVVLSAMDKKGSKVSGIGKIDAGNAFLLAGGGLLLLTGGKIINKILEALGITDSKEEKQVEAMFTAGPEFNPWSPDFWRYGPAGQTRVLTQAAAADLATQLYFAINPINDNEDKIYAIFRSMPTQSCVSSLAEAFRNKYSKDLYNFLREGNWYQFGMQGLTDSEMYKVNQIILALPKYW